MVLNHFLVVGGMAWGKGKTLKEAKNNHRKNLSEFGKKMERQAYLITENTFVDEMGRIRYPEGFAPVEIEY